MIDYFYITTNVGVYKCPVVLVNNVTLLSQTFAYHIAQPDTPAGPELDMWFEEFVELASPYTVDEQNRIVLPFVLTEALARAAAISKLQDMIDTYETWPHSPDAPYIP